MLASRWCSVKNFNRISNLMKHRVIIKNNIEVHLIRNISQNESLLSINKRILEARNKLPKYPESISCSQTDRCQKVSKPTCSEKPGKSPCDSDGSRRNRYLKWILAAAALAGCVGILYFYRKKKTQDDDDDLSVLYGRIPTSSKDIPKYVPYLLIGGGTASFSAFRAIKSSDPTAKVMVISNELHKPYMRPPLSKELWFYGKLSSIPESFKFKQWNGAERSLYYEPKEFYINPTKLMSSPNGGVAVCQGFEVRRIDFKRKKVYLRDGTEIGYDKCLIATGSEPINLDVFNAAPRNVKDKITQYRTPEDFENLKKMVETKNSVIIVGSGFIGSELACALAKFTRENKKELKIYQIFHENGNIAEALPSYLSEWTTQKVQEQGVCVIPESSVVRAEEIHNHLKISLSNGQTLITDYVVVCKGNEPNLELGKASGLQIDKKLGGYVVDSYLQAKDSLYVAGDAACFDDPLLGRRRLETHDHAVLSGRVAGENMVGKGKQYTQQAMFWSDLGPSIGFEGIGIVDSSLPTVGVFAKLDAEDLKKRRTYQNDGNVSEEQLTKIKNENTSGNGNSMNKYSGNDFEKGVIFYLKNDKVVGILLWNLFNRISVARKIINENKKYDDLNEVAKLFEIYS